MASIPNKKKLTFEAPNWFWNYEYRHAMRDATPNTRTRVFCDFVALGLDLAGASNLHKAVIDRRCAE
jgi:hypothetical protein